MTWGYYDVADDFCLGDTVDGMILEAMSKELEFMSGIAYEFDSEAFEKLPKSIDVSISPRDTGFLGLPRLGKARRVLFTT